MLSIGTKKAVEWTLWGITFVGLGLGLNAVFLNWTGFLPGTALVPGSPAFVIIGMGFLVVYPDVFGAPHTRSLLLAVGLGVAAIAQFIALTVLPVPTGPAGAATGFLLQLTASTVFVVLGSLVLYLALRRPMGPQARRLALAAVASAAVVQAFVVLLVTPAVNRAVTAANPSAALDGARSLWGRAGALNAIPLLLFLASYELTYWRIRQRFVPGLSLWRA